MTAPADINRRRWPSRLIAGAAVLTLVGWPAVTPPPAVADPGPSTDLQVTVSGPSAGNGGQPFTLIAVVDDNGPGDAGGATLTITLPTGATDVVVSCTATAMATCPASFPLSGGTVTGTIPTLAYSTALGDGGRITVTVAGRFPSLGNPTLNTTATVAVPSGTTDTNPGSNTSQINTVMNYLVDVGVVKAQSPATITPGVPVTYTMTFINHGPSSADGISIADTLTTSGTAGSIYETYSSTFVSCTVTGGATCPAMPPDKVGATIHNSSLMSATIASFPVGAAVTVAYEVTFHPRPAPLCGSQTSGTIRNTASTFGRTDSNAANNSSVVTLATGDIPDCPTVDLQTTKSASATVVDIDSGDPIDFTVTFTNAGPGDGQGASIADYAGGTLIGGATVTAMSCTAAGGVACPALATGGFAVFDSTVTGPWPVGGTLTVIYTVVFTPAEPEWLPGPCVDPEMRTAENRSQVNLAGSIDPNRANNEAVVPFTANGVLPDCVTGDIGIVKTVGGAPSSDPRQVLPFTLVVTNHGDADATDVSLTDEFVGLSLWSGKVHELDVGTCTVTGGAVCPATGLDDHSTSSSTIISTTIPSLPAGSTVTIPYTLTTLVSDADICSTQLFGYSNTATIRPGVEFSDTDSSNNSSTVGRTNVTSTGACTDVAIIKTVDPTTAVVGGLVVYTLRVTNGGSVPADHVLVRDVLPSFFTYVSSTCVPVVGTPACAPIDVSGGVLTMTLPLLAPVDAVDVDIRGTATGAPGTYANVATATATAASSYTESDPRTNTSQVNSQILSAAVAYPASIGIQTQVGSQAEGRWSEVDTVAVGGSIDWLVTIENTGTVPLGDIVFTDDLVAGCAAAGNAAVAGVVLAPHETFSFWCSSTELGTGFDHPVAVAAMSRPPSGDPLQVTASDPATVRVVAVDIEDVQPPSSTPTTPAPTPPTSTPAVPGTEGLPVTGSPTMTLAAVATTLLAAGLALLALRRTPRWH